MAERAFQWVKTLLASTRPGPARSNPDQHSSGIHAITLPAAPSEETLGSLRLVPERSETQPSDAPAPLSNRRGSERVPCALELEFEQDSHFFTGLSQDISEGGIFVATYERLPVGTRLSISFETQAGPVLAKGEVRWVRDAGLEDGRPGIGIAFTELSPEAAERIGQYCAHRPPLYVDF